MCVRFATPNPQSLSSERSVETLRSCAVSACSSAWGKGKASRKESIKDQQRTPCQRLQPPCQAHRCAARLRPLPPQRPAHSRHHHRVKLDNLRCFSDILNRIKTRLRLSLTVGSVFPPKVPTLLRVLHDLNAHLLALPTTKRLKHFL